MANTCDTSYKVTGTKASVTNLWNALKELGAETKDVYLCDLAKHYGIDYEKRGISVRGHIYWAQFESEPDDEHCCCRSTPKPHGAHVRNSLMQSTLFWAMDFQSVIERLNVDARFSSYTMSLASSPKNVAFRLPAVRLKMLAKTSLIP